MRERKGNGGHHSFEGAITAVASNERRPRSLGGALSGLIPIKNLPLETRQSWGGAIEKVDSNFVLVELVELGLSDFSQAMNKGQFVQVVAVLSGWNVGLHWFVKEEFMNKEYKIPARRKTVKAYEPLGKLLCSLLKLIERCHTISKSGELNCTAVPEYFAAYIQECKAAAIRSIWQRSALDKALVFPNTKVGKTNSANVRRKTIELLGQRNIKNPYNPRNPNQARRYLLTETAIQFSNKFPKFRENYWNPYISAERNWLRHQERDPFFQDFWIELDEEGTQKLCIGDGKQGRGKTSFRFT